MGKEHVTILMVVGTVEASLKNGVKVTVLFFIKMALSMKVNGILTYSMAKVL